MDEIWKLIASLVGALFGGIITILIKDWWDKRQQRDRERQTRWSPLLSATKEFRERLLKLNEEYSANTRRDLWQLFLLKMDVDCNGGFDNVDFSTRGKDKLTLQSIRSRIHELNLATTSLYRAARYLGYAQRVRRELDTGQLKSPKRIHYNVIYKLLLKVREELHGDGAGFVDDLQDLVGDAVWEQDGVISYNAFRERMFGETGWDQFVELFRFFIHFEQKRNYQVKNSYEALSELEKVLMSELNHGESTADIAAWPSPAQN